MAAGAAPCSTADVRLRRIVSALARRSPLRTSPSPLHARSPFTRMRSAQGMSEEERFAFDLEGYLVVRQVLAAEQVALLAAVARRECPTPIDAPPWRRVFGPTRWGRPYQDLIDHPRIVPYLGELLGPKFRLDHDYALFMTKGGRDQDLHGGATDANPDHGYSYRDGVIRCGLTVVSFCLSDAGPGDGGFCCLPGSHKSNLPRSLPRDVREFRRIPHYLVQPQVEAGDAILFTEALIHGTLPWTAEHQRLAVLYKYSPGHSAWMSRYHDLADYPDLTEQQKRILAPPSVGERPDSLG